MMYDRWISLPTESGHHPVCTSWLHSIPACHRTAADAVGTEDPTCQGRHTCGHPSSLGDISPLKVIFSVPSFISAHLFLSQIILIYTSWGINDDFQVHALPIPKFQLSVWELSSWPASEPLMFPDSCPQMFPTAFRLPLNITFPKDLPWPKHLKQPPLHAYKVTLSLSNFLLTAVRTPTPIWQWLF